MIPETLPNVNELCSNDENAYFHIAQPFVSSSTNSVTCVEEVQQYPTTMNVAPLPTCEASIDGVDCQMPATQEYTVSDATTRCLCDYHFRMLLRMVRLWHWKRVMTYADEQQQDERGQVA